MAANTKFDLTDFPPTPRQIWMNKIKAFAEIKSLLDFLKILAVYAIIIVVALLPVIVGFGGMYLQEIITGRRAHEGNSFFGAIPWLSLITFPLCFGLLIIWTILIIKTNIAYHKAKKIKQ